MGATTDPEPAGDANDTAVPESLATRGTSEFDRGLSFYDAIYGFAITLLIANLDTPPAEAWESLDALFEDGLATQLFGFVLSFVVIAAFWRLNTRLVKRLDGLDGPTTVANLVAAGLVILVPFTTQGMSDPASESLALPTAFYAVNIALASLAQLAVFEVGRRRGLEHAPLTARENQILVLDALVLPAVFLASVPLALVVGPDAARWSWMSLVVLAPLSGTLSRRAVGDPTRWS